MDDTATTPVIKSTTISASRMMGREVGGASGSVGKESKIGTLSRILRTTRIKVNVVEGRTKINAEKIKRIKNIIKEQKSDLAEKLSSLDETAEFASVEKGLDEIIKTLQKERKAEEKAAEAARRKKERDRAKSREKKLESGLGKGIKKVVGTVVKPFKSIFDKIFGFLLNVLIGRTIIKLIGWFSDKENQRKVKSLIRFVKDWWPALTAAVLLFGTSFGTMAGGLVSLIGGFIPKLLSLSVRLAAAIARNPYAAAVLVTAGSAVALASRAKDSTEQIIEEKGMTDASPQEQADELSKPPAIAETFTRTILPSLNQRQGFSGGGLARSNARGTDTVPAMLTPGEFVMSRGAVNKFGADTLASMNAMGGGTNKPKVTSGITYAAGGGLMGGPSFAEHASDTKDSIINAGVNVQRQVESHLSYLVAEGLKLVPRLETQIIRAGRFVETNAASLARQSEKFANDAINYYQSGELQRQAVSRLQSVGTSAMDAVGGLQDFIRDTPYIGENAAIERERRLGLMEPGADSLLPEVKERLKANDERIRSLYDPEKDTGFMGALKKANQTIQNKGAIIDPFAMLGLKNEGTEKFFEKQFGIKNLGAKITGLQFAAKGLLGPLGRMFQIDDRGSLGRYLRPALEKAQSLGLSGVGNNELFNEGKGATDPTNNYNALVGDKLANLALGQVGFRVDKNGRAITSDVFDSNNTAEYYFKTSRRELASGNIYGGLFNGLSGVLRVNQNTGWGNLRPGGNDIDLGGGFAPTDASQKPGASPMTQSEILNAQRYAESKGKYFSSADGKTYPSYQAALDAQRIKPAQISRSQRQLTPTIGPPVKPQPKVEFMDIVDRFNQLGDPPDPAGRNNIPPFSPITAGSRPKTDLLGLLTNF